MIHRNTIAYQRANAASRPSSRTTQLLQRSLNEPIRAKLKHADSGASEADVAILQG